jgi:hypothetical protein
MDGKNGEILRVGGGGGEGIFREQDVASVWSIKGLRMTWPWVAGIG